MGRPEDFEAEEANVKSQLEGEKYTYTGENSYTTGGPKRLYRDENHKVLGGVCSGIANYFGIDPIIVRILFVVFFGVTFLPYLILWIAVPSSSSVSLGSRRKRLFRDPEIKMIAGVCSGLAQYFSVQVWIPRLLFLNSVFFVCISLGPLGMVGFSSLSKFFF